MRNKKILILSLLAFWASFVVGIKLSSADTTPIISSIYPSFGPVGTQVVLTGTGFTATNNQIILRDISDGSTSYLSGLTSSNTNTINFAFTSSYGNVVAGDSYSVTVANSNGNSNFVIFNVTQAPTPTPTPTPTPIPTPTPTPTPIQFGPAITVLSPNGGENWIVGNDARVTWRRNWMPDQAGGLVDIYLVNGYNTWFIAGGVQDSIGFSWIVPSWISPGNSYRIRTISRGFGGSSSSPLSDDSDGFFSVNSSNLIFSPTPMPTPNYIPTPTPSVMPSVTPTPAPFTDQSRIYSLSEIYDGDIIRGQGDIAVWIIKIVGDKRYKRWLFGPQVFTAYGHLNFGKVKNVSKETLNHFDTSNLIRRYDSAKVYELTDFVPGISATRRWVPTLEVFLQRGFDFDSVYIVNEKEFNLYTEGPQLPATQ